MGITYALGGDGSPSDKLVIDGGTGTGTSQLVVSNVGGLGDLTQLNGILVVDAINGGTTVPGLFALAGPVVAGPYEYSLYRGSEDGFQSANAWYLRSGAELRTRSVDSDLRRRYPRLAPGNLALCRRSGDDAAVRPPDARTRCMSVAALRSVHTQKVHRMLHGRV
ncbi:autotransporter outer membrane beta-barrel domain-containing protein [Hyphomicrobium sp. D-2]|uniref:autotransporter outer membrane beta-barrel domain-containing protein n=1 Tax=Hyphomicrobium sp. D-2 TaxID=3041621 RepID=UPI0024578300|nr:autotransporter outer membrane beta-barrel domain-containing protein [Hyphomicrobium sp. D-2]MDH4982155.1 autotransporter outer membrane beta-barrel domain-containing protein [Hyphomicrobium sp. D-2]